ncbi:Bifunctional inhibitor/lipid-transfer protein/seed storage 2S albumin superfamily protein [Perilla frutescens var. hirtella]|uniref:Bifunctional inhibitor/lipid-transfer protein/seed storage 2S albumin superfamily protein n=1 Tax=Perilla frutescens var. hirtella TaxID=608512 RepID=A0AAD4INT5_PERFH|nr:Bifunctional inhibitor/lipid-transfer protein/seed storage 2S albumin superfamily protein [Perilla frutescens var. hirtella]KAH6767614.1 Bifunctional inhibitor/lipid-transfer protein/seed storage 2S albumin superfamily protein [Perilla frutescens var. hirtella]KAH6812277.1 Bifunctional inhibitor/lipid-transfer protein/seed storage 2S albumin superfamily protein [Perilla frutescens var. frutescens]
MLMLFAFSSCDNSKDIQSCANSLTGLATCLPYVGGTAKSPTPDCCNGLKQVLKTNKTCLCVIIKDRNDPQFGLNINVTLALGLPDVCNAPANISECPALLKLPPNSPDAQVFYQLGKNGNSVASSPVAGGPNPNEVPTSAPAGAAASGQKNGGYGNAKSKARLVAEILLVALILQSTLVV